MKKKLSEMTLEELWRLFPIFLTEHNAKWKDFYFEKEAILKRILPEDKIVRISHIGSTSIDTIYAKPIVDILVEIRKNCNMQDVKNILIQNEWICMSEENQRISFNMGYTEDGFAEKVYHLHLRYEGDNDELYFRDFLKDNINVAKEYECLKLSLWKVYEYNRDGYTNAKSQFISEKTNDAKLLYKDRYIQQN